MSRPLPHRILMTADCVGGVWTYAMELCRALENAGIEVALATMGAPLTESQISEASELANVQVFQGAYKLEWMESPWADVTAAGDWLLGLAQELSPDLVHLNGYAHAALPWKVPTLVVGHSCVLSWWEEVKRTPAGEEWNHYRHMVRDGLQAADMVVAPSRSMLEALRDLYGPLENVAVIPNGRDGNGSTQARKEDIIFAAGRLWDEAKNIAALATAAPKLSWPVYIAGETKGPKSFEAPRTRFAKNGRSPEFLGRLAQPDVQAWLSRAAIYAFPTKYEPFGLSVLEAAIAGCALVLGDIPSLREIWGDAAIYVPPDDIEALRCAIERLIRSTGERADFANRARARASHYSVERMAAHYLRAYSSLRQRHETETEREAACVS